MRLGGIPTLPDCNLRLSFTLSRGPIIRQEGGKNRLLPDHYTLSRVDDMSTFDWIGIVVAVLALIRITIG